MSCSTCHDVHRPERDVTAFAQKCLACHQTGGHPMAAEIGGRALTHRIDRPMPHRETQATHIKLPTRKIPPCFPSRALRGYPRAAAGGPAKKDPKRKPE